MITPFLETLIWDGDAQYGTWTIGTKAASMAVPANKTVIIIGVDWFPFNDGEEDVAAPSNWLPNVNKVISFQNKQKRFQLLARSFPQQNPGIVGASSYIEGGSHKFDTYFIFTENFAVNIAGIPNIANWDPILGGFAPDQSGPQDGPLGYGTDNTDSPTVVDLNIHFADIDDSEAHPFPQTRPLKNVSFKQFDVAFNAQTIGNPPVTVSSLGNINYPLMTVHYVQVNKRLEAVFL